MLKFKKVLLPIRVPEGKYCWEWEVFGIVCPYYDNEGSLAKCKYGFPVTDEVSISEDANGIEKPIECQKLKTENEIVKETCDELAESLKKSIEGERKEKENAKETNQS